MGIFKRMLDKMKRSMCDTQKYYKKKGMVAGKRCEINKNFNIIAEPYLVKLGDDVRITSGVKFITHDGGSEGKVRSYMQECIEKYENIKQADIFGRIEVGNNVHIGVNAIVMPGVRIGDNVVIGAGAVVTKDIPSNSVAVGVPAKVIKSIPEYVEGNLDKIIYTKSMSYEEKRKYIESK